MNVLIGITGWRATLYVVHWLFLLAIPACNLHWFEYLRLGTLVPRWCVDLYFTTSIDQWDTPRRPLGCAANYCEYAAV